LVRAQQVLGGWNERNNPHSVFHEYDAKAGVVVLKVEVTEPFPAFQLGAVVSDAMHQLRTCLDNIWYSAMASFGVPKPKGNFPIFEHEHRPKWGKLVKDLGSFWPDEFRDIIFEFQPFHASEDGSQNHYLNHPLVHLARLSNKDKHQILRLAQAGPGSFRISYPGSYFAPVVSSVVKSDGEIARQPVEVASFDIDHLDYDREIALGPRIQIPRSGYMAPLSGTGGVAFRVQKQVDDLIADISPFISGGRKIDYDPHEDTSALSWTVEHSHETRQVQGND